MRDDVVIGVTSVDKLGTGYQYISAISITIHTFRSLMKPI